MVDAIGSAIVAGEILPGDSMTLQQLQEEHRTSRTVARECMRILESAQMVVARRRFGIVVQPSETWNPYDRNIIRWRLASAERHTQLQYLTELRLGVEPTAAALAAVRATDEERDLLRRYAAELRGYGEASLADSYHESDLAFHSLVLRASRNYMFAELAAPISEAISAKPLQEFYDHFPDRGAADLHFRTMEAICAGDGASAERLMREILSDVRTGLRAIHTPGDGEA